MNLKKIILIGCALVIAHNNLGHAMEQSPFIFPADTDANIYSFLLDIESPEALIKSIKNF